MSYKSTIGICDVEDAGDIGIRLVFTIKKKTAPSVAILYTMENVYLTEPWSVTFRGRYLTCS